MTVTVDKSLAEDASPTAHKDQAEEVIKQRISGTGNEILLDTLKNMFNKAVAAKDEVQKMQLKSYQWYLSGDYEDDLIDGEDYHVNFVKTLLRNIRSRLSDSNPRPVAIPRRPDDWNVANLHDETMKFILDANDWRKKFQDVLFDAVVKGAAFTREQWDPDMGEEGNVEITYIDPLRFFPGSSARKLQDQGSVFILHSEPLHKVVEKFPEAEMEAAASAGSKFPHHGDEDFFMNRIPMSAFSQHRLQRFDKESREVLVAGVRGEDDSLRQFNDNVNYVEAFLRYPKGHKLHDKFPNGRRTFFTEEAILADQRWEKERLPYTKYSIETEGDLFWNQSIVQQLSSPQRVINKLSDLTIKAAEKQANTPLISPVNGGLDQDEYETTSDVEDKVLFMTPAGAQMTDYLNPPQFPSEALQTMQLYMQQTEELSGVQDIAQGKVPGSLQSGQAIDLLQEAAQTIIRHFARPIQAGIKQLGLNLNENIQEHFTQKRVIRTGDKTHNQFITLNKKVEVERARDKIFEAKEVARAAKNARQRADAQRTLQEAQRAIQKEVNRQNRKEDIQGRLAKVTLNDPTLVPVDIRVASGGDRLSRVGRLKEALELHDRGAIDNQALLRIADVDNKEEIMDRVSTMKRLKQNNDALEERVERMQKAIKEVLSQVDDRTQQLLNQALQSQR